MPEQILLRTLARVSSRSGRVIHNLVLQSVRVQLLLNPILAFEFVFFRLFRNANAVQKFTL